MKKLTILALSLSLVLGACGGGGGSGGGDGGFVGGGGNQNGGNGISKEGAKLAVTDPNSPIYGTHIIIPKDSVTNGSINLGVDFTDTLPGALHPKAIAAGTVVASKVITITKNRPGVFDKPVEIKLPYDPKKLQANAIPIVLAWDASSKSYQVATIVEYDAKAGFVTVQTVNLTALVVVGTGANAATKQASPQATTQANTQAAANGNVNTQAVLDSVDTGFVPERDGFFVADTNLYFNHMSPAGMLGYAKWYFKNKKGPKGLYFDYREGSLDLAFDDNTALEIVDRADSLLSQKELQVEWQRATAFSNFPGVAGGLIYLVSMLRIEQQPQLIMLQLDGQSADGSVTYVPLLVYKFDGATNTFYAYDPRYPGQAQTFQYDVTAGLKNFSFPVPRKVKGFGFISTDTLADSNTFNELYEGAKAGWAESKYGKINLVTPKVGLQNGSYIASVDDFKNVQFTGSLSSLADTIAIRLNGQNSFTLPVNNKQFNFNTSIFAANWPDIDMNANQENEVVLVDRKTTIDRDLIGRRVGPIYGAFKKVVLTNSKTVKFQNGDFELGTPQACDPPPAQNVSARSSAEYVCKRKIVAPLTHFIRSGLSCRGICKAVDSYLVYNLNPNYTANTIQIKPPSGNFMAVHEEDDLVANYVPFSIPKGATRLSFDYNRIDYRPYFPATDPRNDTYASSPYRYSVNARVIDAKLILSPELLQCDLDKLNKGIPCRFDIYSKQIDSSILNQPVHSDVNFQKDARLYQTGWVHVDVPLPAGLDHDQIYLWIGGGYVSPDHPLLIDNIQFK